MLFKNINVIITGDSIMKFAAIQNKLSEIRTATGSRRANQADAIDWAILHAPLPAQTQGSVEL